MYYLETSALRRLAKKLKDYESSMGWFTSGLSISELVSGISDGNFNRRKSILKTVLDSSLGIMWELPNEMIWNAFSGLEYSAIWSRELRKLAGIIKESQSIDEVVETSRTENLSISLEDFKRVDLTSSNIIRSVFTTGLEFIDETVGLRAARSVHRKVISQLPNQVSEKLENRSFFNCLVHIAEGIVSQLPNSSSNAAQILAGYTGSLQYYIEAVSYYIQRMIIENRIPDKNDCVDLSHFLYLQGNLTTKMVSDDNLIIGICTELWPRKYRTSSSIDSL